MSIASYNQFQKEVMQDSVLQEQLKAVAASSPDKLGEVAVKLGAERGYSFTLKEIQAAAEASSNSGAAEALNDEELEMVSGGATPLVTLIATAAAAPPAAAFATAAVSEATDGPISGS